MAVIEKYHQTGELNDKEYNEFLYKEEAIKAKIKNMDIKNQNEGFVNKDQMKTVNL